MRAAGGTPFLLRRVALGLSSLQYGRWEALAITLKAPNRRTLYVPLSPELVNIAAVAALSMTFIGTIITSIRPFSSCMVRTSCSCLVLGLTPVVHSPLGLVTGSIHRVVECTPSVTGFDLRADAGSRRSRCHFRP